MSAKRRWPKRVAIVVIVLLGLGSLAALGGGLWLRGRLQASLPRLDGELALAGLARPVTVERDAAGVPTVRGSSRLDVGRATGLLHAQERFFQMDLLRRRAAGELAALLGPALVSADRQVRVHRFRPRAERNLAASDPENRELLEAYAAGVNAGLDALGAPPPEYVVLRVEPEPWRPEDTTLVVLAMYLDLQGDHGRRESEIGLLHDVFPEPLVSFLVPRGTEWDAPLVGPALPTPPVPAASVFDLRREEGAAGAPAADESQAALPGSNSWAVAGEHTADGGALVANDMHLGIALPNVWYRTSLVWPDEQGSLHRVTGVTLPGAPPIIVGSNGHVAWGFTNSYIDSSDLIVLDLPADDPDTYLTPDGPRKLERFEERIVVHGDADVIIEVHETIWGPVIDSDHRERSRVLRWVAHDLEAVDLGLIRMERARTLDEALVVAATSAIPSQNCVVADRDGRVGWTLMGPVPRRVGHDGSRPASWSDGTRRWDGYLAVEEVPRVVDPDGGRLWTANNRVVGGALLETLGDGGYAGGARARQIRDGLEALTAATPRDLLAIQLDDRALFLERWRDLLLEVLTDEAVAGHPGRAELRELVESDWPGRAAVDSAGYRMVRAFRLFLAEQVFEAITARAEAADDRFRALGQRQWEGPLWRLVTERPPHLLDPRYAGWHEQLVAGVDRVLEYFDDGEGTPLGERTWGERNTLRMQHPISQAVSLFSRWLDVEPRPLPGDTLMPRVQGPTFGASQRMVVSPGREESGIFHMPGGQSGHPLSPHYREGHDAWASGEPTPFLPGETAHTLTLLPAG